MMSSTCGRRATTVTRMLPFGMRAPSDPERKLPMKNKTVLLALSVLFGGLFITTLVLVRTVDVAAVGPGATSVGLSHLNTAFHQLTGEISVCYLISKLLGLGILGIAGLMALLGLIQLVQERSLWKVERPFLALGGLYAITLALYGLFEVVVINYRPILEAGQSFPEASFPSTHTLLAVVILGSLALMLERYIYDEVYCSVLRILCWVVLTVTVVTRLLSGVHWLTDIVAGVFLGACLVSIFDLVLESMGE